MNENQKAFDLNIEKILENWEIHHALREVIANALDEQMLTNTNDIQIYKNNNLDEAWHIRDYGRGLHYKHFTQKENEEKLSHDNLIGQFGIGLKDALATFNRKGIEVFIKSKYLDISRINLAPKIDFNDITTLHVMIDDSSDPNFKGTEFIIKGIKDKDMEAAKKLFLKFSNSQILTTNKYGQIIKTNGESHCIYLNGIKVAEEEKFLFSYNITALDKKIKKALNRERTNVGRNAYSDRVKYIIINCFDSKILEILGNDFKNLSSGEASEEVTSWVDVQEHVVKNLNSNDYLFITKDESLSQKNIIDEAQSSGKKIIFVPDKLKNRFQGIKDIHGNTINDLSNYIEERSKNFAYKFVDSNDLTVYELSIFSQTKKIFELIGGQPKNIKSIKISEIMQNDINSFLPVTGIWDENKGEIIIKRSELSSIKSYSAVLIHEAIHAQSNYSDVTREFEIVLTKVIGLIASKILES